MEDIKNVMRDAWLIRFAACLILFLGGGESLMGDETLELVSVEKIWDAAPHNAFTDLEYFRGMWVCAFREGGTHAGAGDHGKVRVILSPDGREWESAALLESPGYDLRDAKLSITPDGKLLLNSWEYHVDDGDASRANSRSVTFISNDGRKWSEMQIVGDPGIWIWQTSWYDGTGVALGYQWGDNDRTRLYSTTDGQQYRTLLDAPRPPRDKSNEHAMVFDREGNATMLLRRDNPGQGSAGHGLVGRSSPPYRDWEWKRMPIRIGGPSMIRLPDGRLLICVRRYHPSGSKTEIGFLDEESADYTPSMTLPSGGDTSYAGLVLRDSLLWVSYYSSHEGKTSIYLAQINIPSLKPVVIGDNREIFVDDSLIAGMDGVEHRLMRPQRGPNVLAFDKPWEGVFSAYPTVIKAGPVYHLYYRGLPEARHDRDIEVTCHATSVDGIHWHKPGYSLFKQDEFGPNNIILADHPACHNFSPFLDDNPNAHPSEKFKAFGGDDGSGLFLFTSPDGVHWTQKGDAPVFRDDFENGWAFDSQNVGFWSASENTYLLYYRRFIDGLRKIYRVESSDLKSWSKPVDTRANLPEEHLYTNQTQPYFRSPHYYVAFAKRFFPGKVSIEPSVAEKLVKDPNYRKDTADSVLMTSRSNEFYSRKFSGGFIWPGDGLEDWISRSNAGGLGVVPAAGVPHSMYLYRLSHYGQPSAHLSLYKLRTDGFAALSAGNQAGTMTTRPLVFSGDRLNLNYETSAGGSVRVAVCELYGEPIPGFTFEDSVELIGSYTDRTVRWDGSGDLGSLGGKPVQLRFQLKDADIYSFQFTSGTIE